MRRGSGRPLTGRSGLVGRVLGCVVVLVAAAGVGWAAQDLRPGGKPDLAAALDSVPRGALTFSYTDWSQVRDAFPADASDGGRLVLASSARDVSTRSVLASTADAMQKSFGWSVDDLRWEAFAQSAESSIVVARFEDSLSMTTVEEGLQTSGYVRDGDTWKADATDLRAAEVSDLLATVRLYPRQHLLVASDLASAVKAAGRVHDGRSRSLASFRPVADTTQALAGATSIFVQRGVLGCESAEVTDPADLDAASAALQRVGDLEPYTASGRGLTDHGGQGFDGQDLTFAMTFSGPGLARRQLVVREALTSGQFIGRTGQVADTLRLREASTEGSTLSLDFHHDPATDGFMTGAGAVLFATC